MDEAKSGINAVFAGNVGIGNRIRAPRSAENTEIHGIYVSHGDVVDIRTPDSRMLHR